MLYFFVSPLPGEWPMCASVFTYDIKYLKTEDVVHYQNKNHSKLVVGFYDQGLTYPGKLLSEDRLTWRNCNALAEVSALSLLLALPDNAFRYF